MTDAAAKEIHSFQTEVGQLLDIVAGVALLQSGDISA